MDHFAAPCVGIPGLAERPPRVDDHARVLDAAERWWGGLGGAEGARQRTGLLPRLFFEHFTDTSLVLERDGGLVAFLVGFLSQARPDEAYIHFVGTDPAERRAGLATALYRWFFDVVAGRGRTVVRSITSPGNRTSIAFHRALGFTLAPGDVRDGMPVQPDHDGPGLDRVAFVRHLRPS